MKERRLTPLLAAIVDIIPAPGHANRPAASADRDRAGGAGRLEYRVRARGVGELSDATGPASQSTLARARHASSGGVGACRVISLDSASSACPCPGLLRPGSLARPASAPAAAHPVGRRAARRCGPCLRAAPARLLPARP